MVSPITGAVHLEVAIGKLKTVSVYGNDYPTPDGTGVRDYIHVMDLATGHLAALDSQNKGAAYKVINLGTGVGYSVINLIEAFEKRRRKNKLSVCRQKARRHCRMLV